MRLKYCTPFLEKSLKWIPHSKSGAPKSQHCWAADTCLANEREFESAN